ncbi:hypothetical protein [Microbacterium aquilitoris]|uniref:hypothetical protein n=1 Tax=Microbacterium aquilitoris TaxID=3067307 RepID=UPI0028925C83|nr:hypothetical protein [Microbacterium sp. KSW2-22]MDT3343873.1 hypothetical protein [Microbacterium sp. KSW2-22]
MPSERSDADIALIQEVIAHSEFRDIEFYEVSARKAEGASDKPVEGKLSVEVQQRLETAGFGVRVNVRVVLPVGEAYARIAAEYDLEDGFVPSDRAVRLFTNEVGVMMVLPYAREAISTITSKVFGTPVNLPVFPRGEIGLDIEEDATLARN